MAATRIVSQDIKDGTIKRVDLDTTTAGQAIVTKIIAGTNVSLSSTGVDAGTGDVTVNVGTGGTVTSVDLAVPTEFALSGNPITTSGTITISKSNQAANSVWAGPTAGIPAQPTFRALVSADIPNNAADTTGTSGATNALKSATTTINVSSATAPTTGQVLTATSGTAANWQSPAGTGITSLNGLTAASQTFVDDSNVSMVSAGSTHTITWLSFLPIARGGTGATTASGARTALGLQIGLDVQAWDADLDTWATKAAPSGVVVGTTDTQTLTNKSLVDASTAIVDDADNTKQVKFQASAIATATTRTLGVQDVDGTLYVTGGTDVAVVDGGTGASTASGARTNLGLVIGTDIQAWDADLDTWATKTAPSGVVVGDTDTQTLTNKTITGTTNTVAAKSLLSATTNVDVFAAPAPTLGQVLTATSGTAATWQTPSPSGIQSLNGLTASTQTFTDDTNVTIVSAGSAHAVTWAGTLSIARGGTGSSTASTARTALGLEIGVNVQAWDADLDTWATKTAPSGTVLGTTDTQTLTNKTITGSTNTVDAAALRTTGSAVNVSSAAPPTTSQVLRATSATTATWQTINQGFAWTEVTGTSQSMAVGSGYILNNAALVTATLPSTAAVGDQLFVTGKGAGGWKVAQNASQVIHFGSTDTTTGTGGSLASTQTRDTIQLVCVTANTDWNVITSIGNITVI